MSDQPLSTLSSSSFLFPSFLILYVENGRIARLYEYIDAASIMPLFA